MTIVDIAVTILIALYAMIGGAFLNAAITAPANCKKLLDAIWNPVRNTLFWTGILASIAYPLGEIAGVAPQTDGLFELPGVWVALAHIALAVLLRGCHFASTTLLTR